MFKVTDEENYSVSTKLGKFTKLERVTSLKSLIQTVFGKILHFPKQKKIFTFVMLL